MFPSDPDVLVIGAGCAGIAAARTLSARGRSCLVLEGGPRLGGRAFTESASLGLPFDHGASWLHQADDNPLTPLARALGTEMLDHDTLRDRRLFADGRLATREDRAAFAAAEDAFWAAIAAAAADGGPDRPAAEA
uniref:FAD-dependent oxidoreductase n=1 Tax=Neoroseomonas rubea TaxID=2748666 RepID=UPI0018DFB439